MSAWAALVITDLIAVATFARCFTGPGELTAVFTTLMVVHLAGLAARHRLLGRRGTWRLLGAVAAVCLPIAIVLGTTFFSRVPGQIIVQVLRTGWATFYSKVAPVPELPGLVLATAWAAGAAGLLAEMISSQRRVPAVVGLTPAVGIYLFASGFGTGSWRVIGLGAMAASCCWYLAAVVHENGSRADGLVASPANGLRPASRTPSFRAVAVVLPTAVIAAAAAAIIGPNLPGARSTALVAWRGRGAAVAGAGSAAGPGARSSPGIRISSLVQVGQEEVDNPTTTLFTVHSSVATRELIATLDGFDGSSWSAQAPVLAPALRSFATSIGADETRPPAPIPAGPGREKLIEVFEVAALGGNDIPTWGNVVGVAGHGRVSRSGPEGSVVAEAPLRQGSVYAVDSIVADPSSAQLEASGVDTSNARYLQLPGRVPPRIVQLARQLEAGAKTPYDKARALEAYLTSPRFRYQLPAPARTVTAASPPAYGGLLNFLFESRTGYCQQFATAFAVLARADGLPTRIAVGFLPGTSVGHDEWRVEGVDTHAWPQVLFQGYGWIDFEPTPGTTRVGSSAPGSRGTTTPTIAPAVTTTSPGTHNLRPSPAGGATNAKDRGAGRRGGSGAPSDLWLLIVPLAVLCWAGGVPAWRRRRLRRRLREPRAGILAAWAEVSRTLDRAGARRLRAETFVELATRVESAGLLSPEAALALGDLARLATAARYAATLPGKDAVGQAIRDARTVVRSAQRKVAPWQKILTALDLRGLPT
jgi:transglutaminase-like putative cysteine protease